MADKLETLSIRIDNDTAEFIDQKARQCGLTKDEMASAIVALSVPGLFKQARDKETKPAKKKVKAK